HLDVRDVVAVVVRAVHAPRSFDRIERLAHRAVTDGVEVDLEAFRIQPGDGSLQRFGLDEGWAAMIGWDASGGHVRLDHRRSEVLDHPVLHDLDARRAETIEPLRSGTLVDQFLDLLLAT